MQCPPVQCPPLECPAVECPVMPIQTQEFAPMIAPALIAPQIQTQAPVSYESYTIPVAPLITGGTELGKEVHTGGYMQGSSSYAYYNKPEPTVVQPLATEGNFYGGIGEDALMGNEMEW